MVQTDVTGFAIQNDFAVDPGMLGYQHIVETGRFAAQTNAAEAAVPPKPIEAATMLRVVNSPQVIERYTDIGDGWATPVQTEASM